MRTYHSPVSVADREVVVPTRATFQPPLPTSTLRRLCGSPASDMLPTWDFHLEVATRALAAVDEHAQQGRVDAARPLLGEVRSGLNNVSGLLAAAALSPAGRTVVLDQARRRVAALTIEAARLGGVLDAAPLRDAG